MGVFVDIIADVCVMVDGLHTCLQAKPQPPVLYIEVFCSVLRGPHVDLSSDLPAAVNRPGLEAAEMYGVYALWCCKPWMNQAPGASVVQD